MKIITAITITVDTETKIAKVDTVGDFSDISLVALKGLVDNLDKRVATGIEGRYESHEQIIHKIKKS